MIPENREDAFTILLVLESQGIQAYTLYEEGFLQIQLEDCESDRDGANSEITLFYLENFCCDNFLPENFEEDAGSHSCSQKSLFPFNDNSFSFTSDAVSTVGVAVLFLLSIHAASIHYNIHRDLILGYGSSALYIFNGEYYRILTAMALHADIEHLLGNCTALIFLATPLLSITGSLRGSILIIASGASANFINAYMNRSIHLSIGASTAVMGTVGLLAALQIIRKEREYRVEERDEKSSSEDILYYRLGRKPLRSSWLFIAASAATFVGMMSGGENTDFSGHVFGFLAGLIIGLAVIPFLHLATEYYSE